MRLNLPVACQQNRGYIEVSELMLHAREKARKQARQEAAQEAKGKQGGYAAPGGELTGSHGEGSSADCPVCWGGCTHRCFLPGPHATALLIVLKETYSLLLCWHLPDKPLTLLPLLDTR